MKTPTTYAALLATLCLVSATLAQQNSGRAQSQADRHVTSGNNVQPSPERQARMDQSTLLGRTAAISLHAGRYAEAEAEASQALALEYDSGVAEETLAAALDAQGKQVEALQAYHKMVLDEKARYPRVLLPFSLLLLNSGQWAKAVTVYNQALPMLGQEELERDSSHFSLDVPNPTALAVAIHLERGRIYSTNCDWAGETQDTEAMVEYGKALQLAPNYGLANYYYGQGWQKLSPAERKQFGTAQQAKAALQKAVKLGKGNVKLAAARALKNFS